MDQRSWRWVQTLACAMWVCGCYEARSLEELGFAQGVDAAPEDVVTRDAAAPDVSAAAAPSDTPAEVDSPPLSRSARDAATIVPQRRPDAGMDAATPPSPTHATPSWAFVQEHAQSVSALQVNSQGHVVIAVLGGSGDGVSTQARVFGIDARGERLWETRLANTWIMDIAIGPQDTIAIAGMTFGSFLLPTGEPSVPMRDEAFVAKLDARGEITWSRRFGDDANALREDQQAHAVAFDPQGNVILAGVFQGALEQRGSVLSTGSRDAFAIKLDAAGEVVWSRRFDTENEESVRDLGVDASGNILIAGSFEGQPDFGGGPLPLAGGGGWRQFIAKFSATGAHVWSRGYSADYGFLVQVASDGALTLVQRRQHQRGFEHLLTRLDAQGELIESRALDAAFEPLAVSAGNGMYTVAGATRLPDLDKPDLPPMSRPALLEYGPQLDLKRQMAFGEGPVHVARAVGVDATGGLYVAGEFYDGIELGGVKLSGIGLHVYVARFSPDWR